MKLIVGLGNPGKEYEKTRHNTGFNAIDKLSESIDIKCDMVKFKSNYGMGLYGGQKVMLMKPTTYMNNSGEAVKAAVDFYQIAIEDIVVIYDDLDLPVGKLRLREKGSSGGHNGIKSITAHLHTQVFNRIRIGIDKNPLIPTADYVLGKISKDESAEFEKSLDKASEAAQIFIKKNFTDAMNEYNKNA
ncbi:MAG: aminoacyl-tRNA hydrolase [Erysipelotrichaceae bacterium]